MKKLLYLLAAIIILSTNVYAQNTTYRVYTRLVLPTNCSASTSSTDIVVVSNTAYLCINPLAVYPNNWGPIGSLSGSGVSGRVAYWNGTSTLTSNSGFTFDGTNLVASVIRVSDGSASAPSISFSNETGLGLYRRGSGILTVAESGVAYYQLHTGGLDIGMNQCLNFGAGDLASVGVDARLCRDAANVVAIRNSTSAQRLNIANTYTSSSVREDLSFYFSSNIAHIGTTTTGGTARALQIDYGGTTTSAISIPITSGAVTFNSSIIVGSHTISRNTAPTITQTGGGTGATTFVNTNSTDTAFLVGLTAGTTASSTGTIVVTFSSALGSNVPVCVAMAQNANWSSRIVLTQTASSTTSVTFTWDNNGVALTNGTSYSIAGHCIGK